MSYHNRKIVEQFTRWARPFAELPVHSEADGMTRTLAAAGIQPDMKVLDVACGPGIVACAAALQAAHVTGIDLTPAMLTHADIESGADLTGVGARRAADGIRIYFPISIVAWVV